MSTTDGRTLVGGQPRAGGFRPVEPGAGLTRVTRAELVAGRPATCPGEPTEVLLVAAHLADLHICDSQSPARGEFIDRYADPDSPVKHLVDQIGSYRSNEILTVQVAAAMVEAINAVPKGPVTGADVDLAIVTGDNTDNGQSNELEWYIGLLDGGRVHPDSGDLTRYEGVADGDHFDEHFWHPETDKDDLPRSKYGLPVVPGLLDAVRRPFDCSGLGIPWLAVHGNHDRMIQGSVGPVADVHTVPVGTLKPIAIPEHWTLDAVVRLINDIDGGDPDAVAQLRTVVMREVTADPRRRTTTRQEFITAHFGAAAKPAGHGFAGASRETGDAFYRYDHGLVTFLVLDTVNPLGHYQGSLDRRQADWLDAELSGADAEGRYVLLASHHPLFCLTNARSDGGERRLLEEDVAALLAPHRSLIGWLNGHTHANTIAAHGGPDARSWWEITAPSLIDWPQQARVVELSRWPGGLLRIDCTGVDHAGTAPWNGGIDTIAELAGLARELAANHWQGRPHEFDTQPRSGTAGDRDVSLWLPDPFR